MSTNFLFDGLLAGRAADTRCLMQVAAGRTWSYAEVVALSGRELNWLLDGIDVFAMQPHGEVSFETVL